MTVTLPPSPRYCPFAAPDAAPATAVVGGRTCPATRPAEAAVLPSETQTEGRTLYASLPTLRGPSGLSAASGGAEDQGGSRTIPGVEGVDRPTTDGDPSRVPLVYTGRYEPNRADGVKNEGSAEPFVSPKWHLQPVAKGLLPGEKNLQKCYRVPRASTVEVHRSASRSTAAYRGLCTCQSVWQCPICSARISATRAADLSEGVRRHLEAGGGVLLATFTASHTRDDSLRALVEGHQRAATRFWRQRSVREALAAAGYVGRVGAVEVTFGHATGWHPHRHVLLFFSGRTAPIAIVETFAKQWQRAAAAAGLDASLSHGVDIRGGDAAAQYVVKLGLEVALAVRKKGRGSDRFGIWELLHQVHEGNAWAVGPFVEYARTMKGRTHLKWSRGLRDALGLDAERSDADIMEGEGEADEALYATILRDTWRGIYAAGIRGEVLQLLGLEEYEQAVQLLLACGVDPVGLRLSCEVL